MGYDFDKIIDRRGTNSIKHDEAVKRKKPEDALPLWVADMDFQTLPEVQDALRAVVDHGIFGYSENSTSYVQAAAAWQKRHFDWEVKAEWLVKTPGVVFALAAAVRAYTNPGDSILIQRPVYYPFSQVIEDNDRVLINSPLVYDGNGYQIDFEDFERKIQEHDVKMFILCSPHNPVGRVWKKEELLKLGEICFRHQVLVISDEIHQDFIHGENKHHVFASLTPEFAQNTIVCTAPSKTFNLAGLQISNLYIANETLRQAFYQELNRVGYSQLNLMGMVACEAAYTHGDEWLAELKTYLQGNFDFIENYLKAKLPMIKMIKTEGTYLVWLDFSALGLSVAQQEDLVLHKAKLWLDSGTMFGEEGAGFERINVACPRSILEKAFDQLYQAIVAEGLL